MRYSKRQIRRMYLNYCSKNKIKADRQIYNGSLRGMIRFIKSDIEGKKKNES